MSELGDAAQECYERERRMLENIGGAWSSCCYERMKLCACVAIAEAVRWAWQQATVSRSSIRDYDCRAGGY